MSQMGLENRGRDVGLVKSGTPKQKTSVIFVFLSFLITVYAHTGI